MWSPQPDYQKPSPLLEAPDGTYVSVAHPTRTPGTEPTVDATAIPRTTAATMSPKSISQARLVTGPVVRLPALACIHICRSAPRLARCSNTAAARPVAHPYGTDKLPSARVREALFEPAQRSSGGPACARCIAGGETRTRDAEHSSWPGRCWRFRLAPRHLSQPCSGSRDAQRDPRRYRWLGQDANQAGWPSGTARWR